MWAIRYKNIPHIGQDTNAAIESYHGNFKFILTSFRQCFTCKRIDWFIFHLVGNVFTNYKYALQCKVYGFIWKKKAKGIICGVTCDTSS